MTVMGAFVLSPKGDNITDGKAPERNILYDFLGNCGSPFII